MFRFLIGPMIVGVLVFNLVYFISPAINSDPGIVSIFAEQVLGLSTFYFENLPPVIASYIVNLNLLTVALTSGLLVVVVMQLLVLTWDLVSCMARWTISLVKKDIETDEPRDLPPIDMDSSFKPSRIGEGVVGRGLDSIDRDL